MSFLTRLIGGAAFLIAGAVAAWAATPRPIVDKSPYIVVDLETGMVIDSRQADQSWYPASLTKLMTAYVAFRAIADGRATPATKIVETKTAAAAEPVKMGFPVGTVMSLEVALKMLIVPSANDIAVAIAEGLAGSVDRFIDAMNTEAARLGMSHTRFRNPNGLPSASHVSTARDLAVLSRQIWMEFPQYHSLFGIQSINSGGEMFQSTNGDLLGRYNGAEGMKTGFTCDAGYNVAATATRNGRTLLAVVLGRVSPSDRSELAARLLNDGFAKKALPGAAIELAAFRDPAPDPGPVDMRVCNGTSVERVRFTDTVLGGTVAYKAPVKADADIPPGKTRPPVPAGSGGGGGTAVASKAGTTAPQPVLYIVPLPELAEPRRYAINDSSFVAGRDEDN